MIIAALRTWAFGAAFLLLTFHACRAADQTIVVERGTPFPLVLETPFDAFLVGNPAVVDVHSRGDHAVIVEGIALGSSNIVFLDVRGIVIANIEVLVCNMGASRASSQDETGCAPH
jgi:Flp pilus assembly secretin CpaC